MVMIVRQATTTTTTTTTSRRIRPCMIRAAIAGLFVVVVFECHVSRSSPIGPPFPTNANASPRPPIHHQMMVAHMAFGTLNLIKLKKNGIFLLFRPDWLEKVQLQ
jgi:hypothetical protein